MIKIGSVGNIKNIGGVVNLGEIHGNVSAGIDRSFQELDEERQQQLKGLQEEMKKLAAAISQHADKVDKAEETLKRVGKLSEEVVSEEADGPIIARYLDMIGAAVAKAPVAIQCVQAIRGLVGALFS